MVVFTVFEFIRKPWEGKELPQEQALNQMATNLFDTISSYSEREFTVNHDYLEKGDGNSSAGDFMPRINSEAAQVRQHNKMYRQEKIQLLMNAYDNPLETFLNVPVNEDNEF